MDELRDLVVLGGGSGGYAAALRAAQLGLTVTLVEADKLGGTCLHRGCIPTKAQLHAAHVADSAREGSKVGVRSSLEGIDLAGVVAWQQTVVDRLHQGLQGLVRSRDIELVSGFGRLVRDAEGLAVEVDGRLVRARNVVLATGSKPRTLGLPIDGTRILTSDHALSMAELPGTAIVLGGGVIGVEMASVWRSFGVEVTLVEALDRLVPAEDPAVSKALQRALTKRGVRVRTGVGVASAEATTDQVTVELADGTSLSADVMLVAPGRGPVSSGMGFAEAGVALDREYVVVDENLATAVPGVFAVGDLVAGLQLAHRGFAHGMFVAERIAHLGGRLPTRPRLVPEHLIPRVTYSNPEIATVGISQAQAEARGAVEVVEYNLGGNGRSQILGTQGFVKVIRMVHGPVVGVTMVGQGVSELIGEAQASVAWEATPDDFSGLIHAHPTQGEAFGEALLALAGTPLHVHR
ncbi:dihydrolipoyl dehydrogenase [Aestuariimicrobium kwangyangense]|uniref:dihydrolipoyl dehydrogenase n=1 Tax=Aestuariimicrobium kwangyangense TaxID=396389 RepID=UPI0003B6432F|nr:dihydrolipoyl dehydrogenase [Aestuariimicrobium kwangyangense]